MLADDAEASDDLTDEDSEDVEDTEDDDDEEEDLSDSSFAESEEADQSVSSASPSPVRRQSTKRRGTVSPKKWSTPVTAPRTHSKVSAATMRGVSTPPRKVKSPPLGETTRQIIVMEDSDEEVLSEPVKSVKKKR